MAKYIDGYVLPIPKKNIPAYRRMAKLGSRVWREHGALEYRECVGDDLDLPWGVPFPKQLKLKRGETVVFAYIKFRSRKDRDRINKAVMSDPRIAALATKKMPFDMNRMLVGGFTTLVES